MASSSSSSVMASYGAKPCTYDVFLSFRGEDTRHSFTDHLYEGLKLVGISPFRDDDEIYRGEELKPAIEKAIKESRGSIVVLSKNYATSSWCLDELVLILEQKMKCHHFVLPVFYGVEPTDIKHQKGSFAVEVKPSSKWTAHNVSKWRRALVDVSTLAGHVLSGHETIFLKEIVDAVYHKLDRKEVRIPLNEVGMATRYKEIKFWMDQCNVPFLAIYGMGGSGKTTLASYIYNLHRKAFDHVSFVVVGNNNLNEVQEQLLKDISWGKETKIPCVYRGTPKIEEALQMKRTLIVLDDITESSQLDDLVGTRGINAESKIIITTKENTNKWPDFSHRRWKNYNMRLLDDNESSELLCRHAFGAVIPKEGFQEVVLRVVKYCEGHPLALKVLGSSLFNNDTIQFWESQLSSFGRDIDSRIQNVLVKSYETLPDDTVKGLFLHIACFFNGMDMDYVVKILEHDYSALSGIHVLINRCLLSISPNKKLTMHKLVQEMGKNIVHQESSLPAERSRVWRGRDSHKILRKGKGSKKVEGLALDMKKLPEEDFAFKSSALKTDALNNMDNLKLLQLNFVELNGSYENFSEGLRWLCWLGFHLTTIPSDLYMGNLVAIDMSYSNLEVFEPPTDMLSLKILNLKESHELIEIRNIMRIRKLETLILWNCDSLVNISENLGELSSLSLLNMTGCKNLCGQKHTTQPTFSFPSSLQRLFLNDCHLECTDSFPLSFIVHSCLQYMNLGNNLFESLPCYDHLKKLRVLDLSFCSRLKYLLCLPSTLAELYVYYCELLERITFESHRFTLQEIGYEGCNNLYEVEGFIKLIPIAEMDEIDLGHMKWLKSYKKHEVCLVDDDGFTVGRSRHIQMLYEFNIMSTSLPDIKDPEMIPDFISKISYLSFDVPSCPQNRRLKGINVTFKFSMCGEDWAWFCKVSTTNGSVDLMYHPKVFGKPEVGEVCIWLSYWPIGSALAVGDTVNVFIVGMSGLKVHECGVRLVYSDQETLDYITGLDEILGGDLSGFELSTGAYYLCRRDFFELMDAGKSTPHWFRMLVGDTIDYTEVRGWRKTGRPIHVNDPSSIELKAVRCIIHGPQLEDMYKIAEISKSSMGDKTVAFTSSLLEREIIDKKMEEIDVKQYKPDDKTIGNFVTTFNDIEIEESNPLSFGRSMASSSSSSHSFKHEIFLSFRGEDTCKNFVDHLYKDLVQQGIQPYKDDDTLDRGESIGPTLVKAIQDSPIAVVVFSENYADSSWCLDELAHIMECMDTRGQIVMPIFYHVDPSDVRKIKGKYKEAFSKHEVGNKDKVESWRKALEKAGSISGWTITENIHEAICVKGIVGTISDKLRPLITNINKDLIGIETRLRDLKSKLKIGSDGVRIVGIWGVGGGGKTTLASAAYAEISHLFEGHCLLQNISEETKTHGLKKLQEDLLSLVLKTRDVWVGSELVGRRMIESNLRNKRVLVVLDDVDAREQLKALAGSRAWFGEGSRIIITTRNQHLLNTCHEDEVYEVSLLSHNEAIELFNKHAYRKDKPIEDYEMLSKAVVSYADGLPLALEILGSFLYDKNKDEWKSALANLKCIPNVEVSKRLKRSYDELEPDQQTLFLDIACFFRGQQIEEATKVFDACDLHPDIGIKVLVQKSLIKVSNGRFDIHNLIEEMAHDIVTGEHPKNPEKHSRILKKKDIESLCYMKADASPMDNEVLSSLKTPSQHPGLSDVVTKMKKLRWIDWNSYPASSFPSNFQPTKLGYLKLQGSQQKELWHGYKYLPSLKILNLAQSYDLITTPDFDGLPCLERLILYGCKSLEEIHPSIGYHKRLVFVDMSWCWALKRFPPIIHMKKLETLNLSSCYKLQQFPDIQSNMDSLVTLDLGGTGIEIIPPSVGRFCTNLVSLNLRDCDNLMSLMLPQFPRLLRKLNLSNCNLRDGDIPYDICELLNLQILDLSSNEFSRLPSGISRLPCLKYLDLSGCNSLVELSDLPSSIAILEANECKSLERVGDLSDYKWLWKVSLSKCEKLIEGERVLHSMLEGNADADRFMSVQVTPNVEESSIFRKLVTFQLPHNWYSDFSGFLLVLRGKYLYLQYKIVIKHEMSTGHSEKFDEDWKRYPYKSVGYVPFSSLRHIPWLNPTYTKNLSFHTDDDYDSVLSVSLVRSNRKVGDLSERPIDYSECWDEEYEDKKTFEIIYDSESSEIQISWRVNR